MKNGSIELPDAPIIRKKSSCWRRIRRWVRPSYVAWHLKYKACTFFFRLNKSLPGSLYHYAPRPLRKEVFPHSSLPEQSLPTLCMVTPSLNQGAYIRATVESVLQDRLPGLHYLVMDGMSRDNTCQILEELAQEGRFRWQSAPDKGQSDAINRGFAQISGDIMGWINSDDILLPGALRFVAAFFVANPKVDVLYGHRLLIDAKGQEIGRWVVPPHAKDCLKYVDFVPQETLFWRRSLWERAGGYVDENYRFALDWELLQRFERIGAQFARVPYFLGGFRVHEEQKTSSQINGVGKQEMESLRPSFQDECERHRIMCDAVQKELIRACISRWLLTLGIRSTQI